MPFTDIYVAEWGIYHYSYKWIIINSVITALYKRNTLYNCVANTSNLSHFFIYPSSTGSSVKDNSLPMSFLILPLQREISVNVSFQP